MNYFLFQNDELVYVTSESPFTGTPELKKFEGVTYNNVKSRWDFKSFEEVEALASKVTALTGKQWIGTDASESVSPRYDVQCAPCVGDPVSQSFNGDSYPEGHIVKISPTWRITTSTGAKFSRRKNSGSWKPANGYGAMIAGHHNDRNPHF